MTNNTDAAPRLHHAQEGVRHLPRKTAWEDLIDSTPPPRLFTGEVARRSFLRRDGGGAWPPLRF